MQKKFKTAILLASLVVASSVSAFDDKKEGIMISLGLGFAGTQSDFKKAYDWDTGKEFEIGLASSIKLGYGLTEQFSLYLMRNSSFVFGYDNDPKKDDYGNCLTGIGMNYYLTPESDIYLMAAAGVGWFSEVSSNSKIDDGKAFLLGAGYEIYPHFHAEATYLATRIDDDVKVNTDSFQLILNYYWY